ncbi:uncharacterized protein LOC124935285 [Impatiens glandulifera]|uniref:uncharacterized protein LOC124935285 n=1 Tax=Impatiens glandulifera TaxID=253017 RepID=UPI001FB18B60|nr:uncharacterized protein LOC124935285 [Impatiens glandulifera]
MRKTPSKLLKPYQNLIAQSENLRLRESSTRDAPPIVVVPIATAPPADEDVEAAEAEEFVESTFANVGDEDDEADDEGHEDPQDVDEEEEHGSTPDPSSTESCARKRRGKNKNIALSKRPAGTRIPLTFREVDGRPGGVDVGRTRWSRHVGSVVRDPSAVSHRLLKWKALSADQLDYIWNAAKDPFEATNGPIDSFRKTAMGHVR